MLARFRPKSNLEMVQLNSRIEKLRCSLFVVIYQLVLQYSFCHLNCFSVFLDINNHLHSLTSFFYIFLSYLRCVSSEYHWSVSVYVVCFPNNASR